MCADTDMTSDSQQLLEAEEISVRKQTEGPLQSCISVPPSCLTTLYKRSVAVINIHTFIHICVCIYIYLCVSIYIYLLIFSYSFKEP